MVDLAGSGGGLVLQDNGGDNLSVNTNGSFQFATTITSGKTYSVTVLTQPSSPPQQCTITNGSNVAMANITNVKVECGHNEWAWMAGSQSVSPMGTYGTIGVAASGNTPGGRQDPATWIDGDGNLWLFGGYGPDTHNVLLPMNDLWKFSAGEWIWISGPTTGGQNGNYGTLGVASANNIPGARFEAATWTDAAGDFWLFGGNGFDSMGNESSMNDLWKYSEGEWTWVGGSSVGKQNGHYGTLGVADGNNMPGGRCLAATWMDSSGDVWVFGGLGYDASNPSMEISAISGSSATASGPGWAAPLPRCKKVCMACRKLRPQAMCPARAKAHIIGSTLPATCGCLVVALTIPWAEAEPSMTYGNTAAGNGLGFQDPIS